VAAVLAGELDAMLPKPNTGTLLVVGLGNNDAIPDALGPRTVELTYATRHMFRTAEEAPEGLGNVCTISPGVLGMSGIETAEIISGVVSRLQPTAILVVDSLAAASIKRVGTTIQLADSGISPGSGIGNRCAAIDRDSMGCPVVALGVPTVVDTATIIGEAQSALAAYWRQRNIIIPDGDEDGASAYTESAMLNAFDGRLMVTPKDIDSLIADMAEIIAAAIAIMAHPSANGENYHNYIR
jgi:spore protease